MGAKPKTKDPTAREDADRRLAELMLYIAARSEADSKFGATKLNKILFYADMAAYGKLGRPITGQDYQKLERGPAPKRLLPVQTKMEHRGDGAIQQRDYKGYVQKRLIALREPDLTGFSGEEIAIVDSVIRVLWGMNASEVSEMSHLETGWIAADLKEDIPYESVLVYTRTPTPREIGHGQKIAKLTAS
jgi:uncharacterized phage-associated protein